MLVGSIHVPQGGARKRITQLRGCDNSLHRKTSLVQIVNEDQTCMARAIGVCLAKLCIVSENEWNTVSATAGTLTNSDILLQLRKTSQRTFKNLCAKNRKDQTNLALSICRLAAVHPDRPATLNDVVKFETALNIKIAVIAASLGNKFIRVPRNDRPDWPLIYLYLVDHECVSHFHSIVNITGFFSAHYFCDKCFKPYDHNIKHRCETTCIVCKSGNCSETEATLSCRSCHMTCRGVECFRRHLEKKERAKKGEQYEEKPSQASECDMFWRCTTCKKVVNRSKRDVEKTPHKCGEWLCKSCRSWVDEDHLCFMFSEEPKTSKASFIFFDFECSQDTIAQCRDGYRSTLCSDCSDGNLCKKCKRCQNCFKSWCGQSRHVPNFVVAQSVCEKCLNQLLADGSTCHTCGSRCPKCDQFDPKSETYRNVPCPGSCGFREVMFSGDQTLEEFGRWLFHPNHKGCTVLAHNMKVSDDK